MLLPQSLCKAKLHAARSRQQARLKPVRLRPARRAMAAMAPHICEICFGWGTGDFRHRGVVDPLLCDLVLFS